MPETLEQLLKESGYDDAALESVKPLLSDPKFRRAVEAQLTRAEAAEAAAARSKADLDQYDDWYQTKATPVLQTALNEAATARAERAAAVEQLKAAQEYGLAKVAAAAGHEPAAPVTPSTPAGFDASKYVDNTTFQQAFEQTGAAIADAQDLAEEHRELFGTRLNLKILREEALKNRMTVRQYWETKNNVSAKREQLVQEAQAKHDKEVADRAITEYRSTERNPFTRTPGVSNNPFTNAKPGDKQPWDIPENERSNSRVQKALGKLPVM